MLSEKAKGKQRAIDSERDSEPSQTDSRILTIRFTEGLSDLVLYISSTDSVRDVKAKVCVSSGSCQCLMACLDRRCTPPVEGTTIEADTCWATAYRCYSTLFLAEHFGRTATACKGVRVQ